MKKLVLSIVVLSLVICGAIGSNNIIAVDDTNPHGYSIIAADDTNPHGHRPMV